MHHGELKTRPAATWLGYRQALNARWQEEQIQSPGIVFGRGALEQKCPDTAFDSLLLCLLAGQSKDLQLLVASHEYKAVYHYRHQVGIATQIRP